MTENNNINHELYEKLGEPIYKWEREYYLNTIELEAILLNELCHQFRNLMDHQLSNQWRKTTLLTTNYVNA